MFMVNKDYQLWDSLMSPHASAQTTDQSHG